VVYFLTGTSEIYIDGPPTRAEQIVLAVFVLVAGLAAAGLIVLSPQLLIAVGSRRVQTGMRSGMAQRP
jgi:hypothetical protein